ncbi:hypothetical protein AVEN_65162-1 [Araneus ventricosus]|uniref:Uncharacterized protein n=1 Tax=Araneus ventricosus TaxID=182803 RepID=A0A4Y2AFR0_ARAVE|nr:hypothetical protein AVEN_65162-1 [Araneus ventricosus]
MIGMTPEHLFSKLPPHISGRVFGPLHIIWPAAGPQTRQIFIGVGFRAWTLRPRSRDLITRAPRLGKSSVRRCTVLRKNGILNETVLELKFSSAFS